MSAALYRRYDPTFLHSPFGQRPARCQTGPLSELPHELQFASIALEAMELGVGLPDIVENRQFRAEAENG